MKSPVLKTEPLAGNEKKARAPSLRSVVRKSALLNLAVFVTAFPVLVMAGGPNAVVPALVLMAVISVLIWTATFTVFSFVSLASIFRTPVSPVAKHHPHHPTAQPGLADRWLDEPV
jgi:threonine/homoserine/homoserine lactone efflux protein